MYDEELIRAEVARLLQDAPDGEELEGAQATLIDLALYASPMALDSEGSRERMERALASGVTPAQIQEIITLVSGMGSHAYFDNARSLAALTAPPGGRGPFDPERQEIWDRRIGDASFWDTMHEEIPGFLEALLWLSPTGFEAFLDYVGAPFRTREVPLLTKELIGMVADACPAHQYIPGMRMHLRNSLKLGAGRLAIEHAMRIAAASPPMVGVR
ncbi:carboxymuconolactone decarboxylase family protein [Microbacterium sp. KHB019]|uniref:carboxymuconolactone decarboxylase family protein n=1 Tax=Microbacterium sp. KHB019 TaxID=3129770 RepID=UPI003079CEEA